MINTSKIHLSAQIVNELIEEEKALNSINGNNGYINVGVVLTDVLILNYFNTNNVYFHGEYNLQTKKFTWTK